jgi:threonine/homoserine/homoserine lactone efflux protein
MRALVVLVCYLVAAFLPGPVLQLVAPWSSRGGFVCCLVGGF